MSRLLRVEGRYCPDMGYKRKRDGVFRDPATGRMYEHRGYSRRIFWSRQMLDDLRRLFPTTINDELAEFLGVSVRTLTRKAREIGVVKDPEWLAKVWEERRKWAVMSARRKGFPGSFRKGEHANRETEFKPGHQLTEEQAAKRKASMREWNRMHPGSARARSLRAWETRRMNNGKSM